jgi:Co/Zn/Cd efflux system component
VPSADVIGGVGVVALAANAFCLVLLARHRGDDINMRSAWLCSRNDVVANVGVLLAAGGVGLTGAAWPDIAIGLLIAMMFGSSAIGVIRARHQLRFSPIP